jgi:hypothetical protein
MALLPLEKAIIQIIMSANFIEDSKLKAYFFELKHEMNYNGTLPDAFTKANISLRKCNLTMIEYVYLYSLLMVSKCFL